MTAVAPPSNETPAPKPQNQHKAGRLVSHSTPKSRLNQKFPLPHNQLILNPDVEPQPNHIDVRRRPPLRPRVLPIWIPKRNMDPRKFLVLQNVANHPLNPDIRPDRKLAHPVGILIGMRVSREIRLQLPIFRPALTIRLPRISIVKGADFKSPYCAQR